MCARLTRGHNAVAKHDSVSRLETAHLTGGFLDLAESEPVARHDRSKTPRRSRGQGARGAERFFKIWFCNLEAEPMRTRPLRIPNCSLLGIIGYLSRMTVYLERAGLCTRCHAPFGGNMPAIMVRQAVPYMWGLDGNEPYVFMSADRWTPVCDACATPSEAAAATTQGDCAVCGQRMVAPPPRRRRRRRFVAPVCSSRCYQRQLRERHRSATQATCAACGLAFVAKRADARFCSAACRQRAYRQRG